MFTGTFTIELKLWNYFSKTTVWYGNINGPRFLINLLNISCSIWRVFTWAKIRWIDEYINSVSREQLNRGGKKAPHRGRYRDFNYKETCNNIKQYNKPW